MMSLEIKINHDVVGKITALRTIYTNSEGLPQYSVSVLHDAPLGVEGLMGKNFYIYHDPSTGVMALLAAIMKEYTA